MTQSLTQNIGGELILLTQLVSPNTPVYGYSLFAYDTFNPLNTIGTTCTLAKLSSVSNTDCYISNTGDTNASTAPNGGGIDLLAVNLGLTAREGTTPTPLEVPEPLSIIGTILGGIAAFRMQKSIK